MSVSISLEKSGKQTRVYEGERTAELDDWCEADSNRTGCVLRMQDAVDTWVFKPAVFTPDPDGPPIGDAPKDVVKVYVINGNTETLLMELDKASGWRGRCDDHVRRTGEALKANCWERMKLCFLKVMRLGLLNDAMTGKTGVGYNVGKTICEVRKRNQ